MALDSGGGEDRHSGGCLAGRRVAVTGAARGLGAALAIILADVGMEPLLLGRSIDALEGTAAAVRERTGRQPPVVELDLADLRSVERASEQVLRLAPELDVLVNNGAQWQSGAFAELDPVATCRVVHSALTGTMLLTQALLPALLRSSGGDVVNVVSMSGLPHTRLQGASVPFYAGKHGQAGFTEGLRQELAGTPVRVIGIYPPVIESVSPVEPAWEQAAHRRKGQPVSTRDVVEAVLFALTLPRSCTVASIVLDADSGGIYGG